MSEPVQWALVGALLGFGLGRVFEALLWLPYWKQSQGDRKRSRQKWLSERAA